MDLIHGHRPVPRPQGIPVLDIDPYDEAVLARPEPYYEALRAIGPFAHLPDYGVLICGRYAETHEVFSDHTRFISSRGVGMEDRKYSDSWRKPSVLLERDPPEHTRTRRVMARVMSPKAVAAMRDLFVDRADALVENLVRKGSFEVVSELAEPYPTTAFVEAIGLTDSDPRKLVDYGAMVFNGSGPLNGMRRRALDMAPQIVPWIEAACDRRRIRPDGLAMEIYRAADAGEIDAEEAEMLVRSLLSAGVDTTVTGIGSAIWCLAHHPDEYRKLRESPDLLRPCIEEVLRFTSPVHTFARTACVDTEVGGVAIGEDTRILCCLGAANLDPAKWGADADRFRIDRRPAGHMAFGAGVHGCVGQNIARAEIEAVLAAVTARIARIEPEGEAIWRPANAMRSLDSFRITVTADK